MKKANKQVSSASITPPSGARSSEFRIDWLSFTFKGVDIGLKFAEEQLGLTAKDRQEYHARNYEYQWARDGMSVFYGGQNQTCHVALTGMGVAHLFSRLGLKTVEGIQNFLLGLQVMGATFVRVDFTWDTRNLLFFDTMEDALKRKHVTGKLGGRWGLVREMKGSTCVGQGLHLGSRKSERCLRIYDKSLEQGTADPKENWIRLEYECKRHAANAVVSSLIAGGVTLVLQHVLSDVHFRIPLGKDSFKYRWPTAPYWLDFIGSDEPIKVNSTRVKTPIDRFAAYVARFMALPLARLYLWNPMFLEEIIQEAIKRISPDEKKRLQSDGGCADPGV